MFIIYGTLIGPVQATECVFLSAESEMKGDIAAARLFVQDGARFRGSVSDHGRIRCPDGPRSPENRPGPFRSGIIESPWTRFQLESEFSPKGDQIRAIEDLTEGLDRGLPHQVLMGVTGSGKTFTIANVIARAKRPVLVISHNKTLAAQLYQEFRRFFPGNAVEYFVSYYDYYQPEAYIPSSNTYIAKEVTINDEIDRMRLNATNRLFERRDVIIVASVSCIYGIGAPETYYAMSFPLAVGDAGPRKKIIRTLVEIQYERQEDRFQARRIPRPRATSSRSSPPTPTSPTESNSTATGSGGSPRSTPCSAGRSDEFPKIIIHPRTFFSTPRSILDAVRRRDRRGAEAAGWTSSGPGGLLVEAERHRGTDAVRPGHAPGVRLLPRASKITPSTSAGGNPASRRTRSSIIFPATS